MMLLELVLPLLPAVGRRGEGVFEGVPTFEYFQCLGYRVGGLLSGCLLRCTYDDEGFGIRLLLR